ncbi:MAG: inorganic phosphate transporter [Firmicutes bacterium]|nr:inorganic phosphate transporter [Bacillota bacterium]
MTESIFVIIFIVLIALAFDFINGFHDTANAIATSIATGALMPRQAIILASTLNFLGAILFTGVAHSISKGIADPMQLQNAFPVVLAALIAAIFWNLLTWYLGLPSSSSHALIGSLTGAVTAAAGWSAVNSDSLLLIIQALIYSPLLAGTVGFIIMLFCNQFILRSKVKNINQKFKKLQVITAAFQAFSHGTNDAQKTMGVITFALVASGIHHDINIIPLWVKFAAALAMALGTAVGGWRIINTVGKGITNLQPPSGVSADLTSAAVIMFATILQLPVSTTHVISSSIAGVGLSKGVNAVNWSTCQKMLYTWVLTVPGSYALAALIYLMVSSLVECI